MRKDPHSKKRYNKSHLPILLFTLPLVLSESSSRPLSYILGAVTGIVWGTRLPWDINCRFSSARRPLLSVRLGINMQSGSSERGRGGRCMGWSRRLGRGEGGGWWWNGGDFGGGYGSKRPWCFIVSHAGCGSGFGRDSRGNGHRLNYFCGFSLLRDEKQQKRNTQNHTKRMQVFWLLAEEITRLAWSKAQKQALPRLWPWNIWKIK